MFKDTVTVFCRKGSDWYPTVLHNVNLNIDRASIVQTYGENSADRAILNVHIPADKPYLPPKEWQELEEPSDFITFKSGQKFDFFWAGEWEGDPVISDTDYGLGTFYDYMNKNEDFVFAVTGCGYFSVIPHLEVTGK